MHSISDFKLYQKAWVSKVAPHLSEKITKQFAYSVLKGGGLLLRNVYNWDKVEHSQFWYVIKDTFGGIDELPSKVRNQVRKSIKTYQVRKVSSKEMAEKGFELYNRSRERFQDASLLLSREAYTNRVNSKNRQYWLAIHREGGKAMAFAIVNEQKDYVEYRSMGVDPNAPGSTYPMYGLIFEMNRYYLEECGKKYVMDGARSITQHSMIQPFLEEKFRFRKAYCDLQVFYKPLIGLAVNLAFPFRKVIKIKGVKAILNQEAMRRGLEVK